MPRMSEADKQRSHHRILEAAARLFRENGIETTSVADVMKAAGMTHGGFYRHFNAKEDLVAAAFRHAVDTVVSGIEQAASPDARVRERDVYVETYLSPSHVANRGRGCPLAAMAAELGRTGGGPRHEGAVATARMAGLLAEPNGDSSAQGRALMAVMMGAVTLARLAETDEDATQALDAGRIATGLLQAHWPTG